MTIQEYISKINSRYISGISTEHSYRGDLQNLLESMVSGVMVTNEPSRVACGAPDYILTRKNIPVGYIEAKDIGADLDNKVYKEQFDRYKASLHNLIITDYLTFRLFHDGALIDTMIIGTIEKGKVIGNEANYDAFRNFIVDFSTQVGKTITSAEKLAKMMAGKARMLATIIENALLTDEEGITNVMYENANNTLREQLIAFQQILIHDIKPKEFADIYAQTITYGMFAGRLHDTTSDTFTRKEAADLIPKSNPFLRKLFQYIAGYDLDDRLKWIVDALADIFRATDVAAILKNFGKATQQNDPMIHFYETFLGEYDPKLRKSRGVWYTPEPVVNFIVRAVDDILKTEFGLTDGLADTSKTKVKIKIPTHDYRMKVDGQKGYTEVEQEVHKVQILDPAAGTGTFLAEIVKQIYKRFEGQQGIWNTYVDEHLIPRLNGFELLMASYAMAHLKLDLLLTETGYKPTKDQRFRVYLTNSLEEYHPDTGTLFAGWLSTEANEANHIKRDTPVMVVLGNPPYSGESQNKGNWIMNLMEDYKKEPGGIEKLKEKTAKWINDDYVKFLRYGQYFVERNEIGILAFINPHGFLDNPTFRGMRWNMLKTYDKIYILDLHGNSKKKEIAIDGSVDVNVFDIQQGVSINLFIKTGKKRSGELAEVYHSDLFGTREYKYEYLWKNNIGSVPYKLVQIAPSMFFMVDKDLNQEEKQQNSFSVKELFIVNGGGITTAHDNFVIDDKQEDLLKYYQDFQRSERDAESLHNKFNVAKKEGWNIIEGYDNIKNEKDLSVFIKEISYRPFDNKFIFYEDKLVWRTVRKVMQNYLKGKNVGLLVGRQGQVVGTMQWNLVFITNNITDFNFYYRGGGVSFPLYLYPENDYQQTIDGIKFRNPNLNKAIVKQIEEKLGLNFTCEKEQTPGTFAPIDILDYIYAVLHSPKYREKYKKFLKIDFPRVPYPRDAETFWQLVKLGVELRQIHLLESKVVSKFITKYPVEGNNAVDKVKYEDGKVWINDTQYFD